MADEVAIGDRFRLLDGCERDQAWVLFAGDLDAEVAGAGDFQVTT